MPDQNIIDLTWNIPKAKQDTAVIDSLLDGVLAKVEKIEQTRLTLGKVEGLGDFKKAQDDISKGFADVNQSIDNFNKGLVSTVSTNQQATKSFTQFSDAVEANVAKQKKLKKELEDIKTSQKQLSEFNSKINFTQNPEAQVKFEEELLALSEKELLIKKQIAELNVQLKDGNSTGSIPDSTVDEKVMAHEREELRQRNAELKATVQLELAEIGSINEARASIALLTKERNNLNLSTEEGVKRQQELNAQIDKYNAFIKVSVDKQGAQKLNVGNYPNSSFSGAYDVLASSLNKIKQQLADPALSGKQLESLQNEEALLLKLTANLSQQFTSTKTELRAFQEAAAQLGVQLGGQNETFAAFAEEVGVVKDQLGDLQAAVNFNASDTRFLDGAIEAVNGLAGAYGVAEGAAALFGDNNEQLQKEMVKLQAIMTIVT
ncbi:MAG TPA: hypothetical protein VF610_12200, partial [Segetibacter sp.]